MDYTLFPAGAGWQVQHSPFVSGTVGGLPEGATAVLAGGAECRNRAGIPPIWAVTALAWAREFFIAVEGGSTGVLRQSIGGLVVLPALGREDEHRGVIPHCDISILRPGNILCYSWKH